MTNNEAIGILAIAVEMAKGRCFVTDEAISDAYAMAISALQAQDSPKPKAESVQNVQNEDLISRKAAIDAECEVCQIAPKKERGHNCTYYVHGCKEIECLRALPSAQPEPQWIPINERLPKLDEAVFVTTEWDDLSIAWRIGIDKWFIHEGNTNATTDDLTAWMPLPEPYRAERRTDAADQR